MAEEIMRGEQTAGTWSSAHAPSPGGSDGRPLDRRTRRFFESRLGHDLSGVRIHTDDPASQSARALNARAYTVGSDIVFAGGEYKPDTHGGRLLLAHELAHVVQHHTRPEERGTIHRQPASPEHVCVPGLPLADPVCPKPAEQRTAATPISIVGEQSVFPAGVGLLVPRHPDAVSGIHDWHDVYGAPGSVSNRNRFRVGTFRLQQICTFDASGAAKVYVYYVSDTQSGDKHAVGPDSLRKFVADHGGVLYADARNTDQVSPGPRMRDPRTLPAAPGAFRGDPTMYYVAPVLPAHDGISDAFVLGGYYQMRAYLRRRPDGTDAVLYYLAENIRSEWRPEYVVGPHSLEFFSKHLDLYAGMAAYAYPIQKGAMPAEYQQQSARFVMGVMTGDVERASSGTKAWKAAATDPSWWLQVLMGYTGAARPPTPAPRPSGPPIRGVIQGGKSSINVPPAEPVTVRGGGTSAPYISREATARALAGEPAPITPPAPRHLQSVPAGAQAPAPLPVPKPISPAASAAGIGAASRFSTAPAPRPDVDTGLDEEQKRGKCTFQSIAQQFGRYPCHAAYATRLSGVSREVRTRTPDGLTADFDAMDHGGVLYEVKTGYRWLVFGGDPVRQNEVISRFWMQAVTQMLVADTCGLRLKWCFNDPYVASFFGAVNAPHPQYFQAPLPVEVWYVPYNCNVDSDG